MMRVFLITADRTNGDVNRFCTQETSFKRARATADLLHRDSSLMNVELTEPLGVLVEGPQGIHLIECKDDDTCQLLIKKLRSKHGKKAGVRKARITAAVKKTARSTPEDELLGEFLAEMLESRQVLPSVKFDINRWMDSKEWV